MFYILYKILFIFNKIKYKIKYSYFILKNKYCTANYIASSIQYNYWYLSISCCFAQVAGLPKKVIVQ